MITTEETLTVNGVVLNTLAHNISSLTGRLQVPALRTDNISVPGRHGVVRTRRKMYEEGQVILPMWVRDTDADGENPNRETLFDNIDKLTKLFRPGSGLLEVVHTLPDGSKRRVMAECTQAIDLSTKGRSMATYSVALRVPSVFWEDETQVVQDLSVPHTGPVTALTGMTAPLDDAVFLVTGPITNVRVEAYLDGAPLEVPVWWQYSTALTGGQTVTVDCAQWKLTSTGGHTVNYANFSHGGSPRWLVIEPGKTDTVPGLAVTGSSTTGATKVRITARRKYLVG